MIENFVEIIACYRPPNDCYLPLDEIGDRMENRKDRVIVAVGDLNLPDTGSRRRRLQIFSKMTQNFLIDLVFR